MSKRQPANPVVPAPHLLTEERLRDLFDSGMLGIFVSQPDGRLLTCNESFARILGFESVADALAADMVTVHASPEHRASLLRKLKRHGRLERVTVTMRRQDGSVVHVLASVAGAFDVAHELTEIRGFIIDITASTLAEAELKEREQRFESVFLDAADAMLLLDDRRRITHANRAAQALFGSADHPLIGGSLDALVEGNADDLEVAWRELLAFGEARREHQLRHESRLVECSYRLAAHAGGYLCIARDITHRRSLEERLVQSEKIESVGRLAGGIAHDFNNLLTAILGYTELLLSSRGPDDPDRADLEEIQRAGHRAAALTHQLLAYSRKQVLIPKEVDLNRAVVNLQGMLTRLIREDILLTCDLWPTPAVIRIDPTQLEQVILNLVINSRDALPGGGSIRLEVASVRLSEVDVPSDQPVRAGEFVRLRVIDNGVGIPRDARPHLFEPFFTTKEIGKGTGLGLASVYGIVRQSNGFITVDSESGLGTTFTMHFPAVMAAAGADQVAGGAERPASGQETILLVEDEDAVRVIAAAVLRRQGYKVIEVANGRAACEVFEQRGNEIDLLLTDVVMPEMNGPTLAQRLVAARPSLRVLFISGYTDAASPLDDPGMQAGFLNKPFQASMLANKVREVLSRPRVAT